MNGLIVCYAKCWGCNLNHHPGGWHSWADAEDIEAARMDGKPDPSGQKCRCHCADRPAEEYDNPWADEDYVEPEPEPDYIDCLECAGTGEVNMQTCLECLGCGELEVDQ